MRTAEWFRLATTGELVDLAKKRDRQAMGCLYERFNSTLVVAIALIYLRNPTEAEELASDVWLHAFEKLHQLRDSNAFPGWLRSMVHRMSINKLNRRRELQELRVELRSRERRPDQVMELEEHRQLVREAVDLLASTDPLHGLMVRRLHLEGLSLKQIADLELQADGSTTPIGTLKRRAHTGRKRVRELLPQSFAE